jgi:hypothetical protein
MIITMTIIKTRANTAAKRRECDEDKARLEARLGETGDGKIHCAEAQAMNSIGECAEGFMWGAGLAVFGFLIYGFCHLVPAWLADDDLVASGYMLSWPRKMRQ